MSDYYTENLYGSADYLSSGSGPRRCLRHPSPGRRTIQPIAARTESASWSDLSDTHIANLARSINHDVTSYLQAWYRARLVRTEMLRRRVGAAYRMWLVREQRERSRLGTTPRRGRARKPRAVQTPRVQKPVVQKPRVVAKSKMRKLIAIEQRIAKLEYERDQLRREVG